MSDSLNPFDLLVIVVAVLSTFWGGMRGVVSQITSILSWLASWYVATHYYSFVARFIDQNSEWRVPASMVITFVASALAIRLASNFIKQIVSFAGLKEFDRQMGALLGLCKGLLLCFLVAYLAVVASEKSRSIVENARTGPFFVKSVAYIQDKLPESELTKKFRSIAGEIEEQDEQGEKLEAQEADVNNLRRGLISKGFLSDYASKIVEEAAETRPAALQGENDAPAPSNTLQNFLRKAEEWKEGVRNLTQGGNAARREESNGLGVQSGINQKASFSGDDAARTGTRGYYSYDSASASAPENINGQNYSALPYRTSVASESSFSGNPETSFGSDAAPAANYSTEAQNAATRASGLESFLNTFGGGFGGGSVGSSDNASSRAAFSSSNDEYSSARTSTMGQTTNRSRSNRTADSNESRARLSSRSYTIGSPSNY